MTKSTSEDPFTGTPAKEMAERLRAHGVLVLAADYRIIRAVTNLMVSADDIPRAVEAIAKAAQP